MHTHSGSVFSKGGSLPLAPARIPPQGAFQKLKFLESFLDLHYAMFKIKSLQYKDLILNSTGCRKSNRLLRQPLFVGLGFLSQFINY